MTKDPAPAAEAAALNPSPTAPASWRTTWPVPAAVLLTCLLFAAHLTRAGAHGTALACLIWALLCFLRRAWMRCACTVILCVFAVRWFMTGSSLIQMRLMMGAPWLRLVAIIGGIALFTLLSCALVWSGRGRGWFYKKQEHALPMALGFLLTCLLMLPPLSSYPPMLLADRFFRFQAGALQVLAAGLWAAFVAGRLLNKSLAAKTRLRIWPLFSLVFFAQFALALAGCGIFSMTGSLHIPVPGVIIGGAVYRLHPGFMLFLFLFSVILAGPAWCSHLCYFGSWDALAASCSKPSPHPHPLRWRLVSLVVVIVCALALRLAGAPTEAACACGIFLGILIMPAALLFSRKKGIPVYCTMICPLGLISCLAGRLSPWRMRNSSKCTQCGACAKICRYGALTKETLQKGRPGLSCTLCRDCEAACRHGAMQLTFAGRCGQTVGRDGIPAAEQVFAAIVSALHAAFLFTAMV